MLKVTQLVGTEAAFGALVCVPTLCFGVHVLMKVSVISKLSCLERVQHHEALFGEWTSSEDFQSSIVIPAEPEHLFIPLITATLWAVVLCCQYTFPTHLLSLGTALATAKRFTQSLACVIPGMGSTGSLLSSQGPDILEVPP